MAITHGIFQRGVSKIHRKLDQHHDRRLNIETSSVINISDLNESVDFGDYEIDELYSATPMILFNQLHSIVTQKEKTHCTYIDVGCGKGRTLIKGLKLGFKNLIGVEFVPSIAEQGKVNLENAIQTWNLDATCEIICEDIRSFQYPKTDLILYLYNPFDSNVFEGFLENLLADLRETPRQATLIYYHSHCEKNLDDCDELERINYSLLTRMQLKILSTHDYGVWRYKHKT